MKIDLGCGKNKKQGFIGIDSIAFEGVDIVCNIGKDPLPFKDEEVEEVHASHFVEHLTAPERIHLANELFRVMQKGAKCTIIVPHFASCRAYGDLTHQWPPVSEFWFLYLNKAWREINAPHSLYSEHLDFDHTLGYSLRNDILVRSAEFQQFAMQNYKEVCQDIIATLIKK